MRAFFPKSLQTGIWNNLYIYFQRANVFLGIGQDGKVAERFMSSRIDLVEENLQKTIMKYGSWNKIINFITFIVAFSQ